MDLTVSDNDPIQDTESKVLFTAEKQEWITELFNTNPELDRDWSVIQSISSWYNLQRRKQITRPSIALGIEYLKNQEQIRQYFLEMIE